MELGYQEWATGKLIRLRRAPLFGRMGSGKTKILLDATLGDPEYTGGNQPILVLCGGNSIGTWISEPQKWWGIDPSEIAVARGSPIYRHNIWINYKDYKIIITTYGTLLRDHAILAKKHWFAILADEAHKWRNRKTKTCGMMKGISKTSERFHPATGTPYRKGPQNIFAILNMSYPKPFASYWKYINTFCLLEDNGYGNEILGPRNLPNFIKMLDRYVVDLPDDIVEKELPEGSRIPISLEMSATQQRLYDTLADELLVELPESDNVIVAPTILSQITKLRQLLVCPKLWDPEIKDYGAGIELIGERLEEDSHAIIFVPFTKAMPFVKEYLEGLGHKSIGFLKGQITATEQARVISEFEREKGIILCSVAYAESFSLGTCKQAYFLGQDWSFDVNEQAEGRIRRRDSVHRHTYWYYLKHMYTIEETLVALNLSQDYSNVKRIKQTAANLRKIIKGTT